MGANTLRSDNPEMRGTNGSLPEDRIRSIITRSGTVNSEGKKLFQHGPRPVVFTSEENMNTVQDNLKDKARVISLPVCPHGLSLDAALDYFAENGIKSVLIEGGAKLNYSVLAQGLVDEVLLTVMPFISGDTGRPSFADGPESLGDPFLEFELLSCETVSTGEVFLHFLNRKKN
jgi:riboflavin biosynthesis pyrimidine reductase